MVLSIQEIVYAFLQVYYQRMKSNPGKLANLYSSTAELAHINYTQIANKLEDIDEIPTVKLTGRDNISKFFSRHEKKVSDLKVKIDSCDFQTTGINHKNILISVTGELFWPGSQVYQFCQTFILNPVAKSNDIYDISNDIIRFIPNTFQKIELVVEKQGRAPTVEVGTQELVVTTSEEKKKSQASKTAAQENIHSEDASANSAKGESSVSQVQMSGQENDLTGVVTEQIVHKENSASNSIPQASTTDVLEEKKKISTAPELTPTGDVAVKKDSIPKELSPNPTLPKELPLKETMAKEDPPKESSPKEILSKESSQKETTTVGNLPTDPVEKETALKEDSVGSEESPKTEPTKAVSPTPSKLSWASKLASVGASKESKKIMIPKNVAPTTTAIPESPITKKDINAKKILVEKKSDMGNRKDNNSNRKDRKKPSFSLVNKEGYYPIYVSGTFRLSEEDLKRILTQEFGTVMKINSRENFSVVDFQTQASQIEAIERGRLTINGTEVTLERKTIKKSSSPQAINGGANNNGYVTSSSQKIHRKLNNVKRKEQAN
ncbi:Bre5p KNAG_0D00170 [Huiozyma naganishii CBS 8797]|uniref:NTF2 domain-containing protein n=1 Tax=Huiozyma naganishii (strain ATCC MYA-139 / BCRC 22969 / CBS 8797 / KCTC 17520 / NBRC 10181 / NCYC 3082 / Yp74L-3) TaxID=1071383 RepID=J7S5B7_HUIN7|nr:hypothetical protein KNAG_0D00170 [Kazachstania naganishii CBS 8797]CCK69769.1 hypothetical protein KNAG_0D00170 [Kazachstania naganishii CBS 8797]